LLIIDSLISGTQKDFNVQELLHHTNLSLIKKKQQWTYPRLN
jgi:hypothetical protein